MNPEPAAMGHEFRSDSQKRVDRGLFHIRKIAFHLRLRARAAGACAAVWACDAAM
jgi:hypothetical protein